MARITHVAAAQQRYETVPVLDAEGNPKKVPVMRNGVQRTTKSGRAIFMTLTMQDRTRPLPPRTCDYCRKEIAIGSPYKHISPKSGPYGGRQLNRHESCPTWQVWDYSSSLSARLAQVAYDFSEALSAIETPDDVQSALDDAASTVREIAEEKRESASNIEAGFGHETEQSTELDNIATSLDEWADEIDSADVPELPEPEETDCDDCDGTGKDDKGETCEQCAGDGTYTPEDPTDQQMTEWADEVRDSLTVVDESPV